MRRPSARTRTRLLIAVFVVAVTGLPVACSINPATGERQLSLIGTEQEIAIGRENHEQVVSSLGLYEDEHVQAYVRRIGQELAAGSERPDLPWTFAVVNDPAVNAFALPGGFIYLTRGIMTHLSTEAQMAAVLGHEIGHVTARHSVEQLSRQQLAGFGVGLGMVLSEDFRQFGDLAQMGMGMLFLKFGRDDERQADTLGLLYLADAGYDVREMPAVFSILDDVSSAADVGRVPGWLSTHPSPENRIERISSAIAELPAASGDRVARDTYLEHIDGMVYGDDPREGFFEESLFLHPELRFQIRFPDGWKTANQKQAVLAVSPSEDAIVVLTLSDRPSPRAAEEEFFAQTGVQKANVPVPSALRSGDRLAGYFVVDRAQGEDLAGLASFESLGGRVYVVLAYSAESRVSRYQSTFVDSAASFGALRDPQALNVQPRRIDVVKLPRAMTLEEFSRRYTSTVDLDTLALLNQASEDSRLAAGTTLKRVTGGR
jgi:predicted Zn-dependent protease